MALDSHTPHRPLLPSETTLTSSCRQGRGAFFPFFGFSSWSLTKDASTGDSLRTHVMLWLDFWPFATGVWLVPLGGHISRPTQSYHSQVLDLGKFLNLLEPQFPAKWVENMHPTGWWLGLTKDRYESISPSRVWYKQCEIRNSCPCTLLIQHTEKNVSSNWNLKVFWL